MREKDSSIKLTVYVCRHYMIQWYSYVQLMRSNCSSCSKMKFFQSCAKHLSLLSALFCMFARLLIAKFVFDQLEQVFERTVESAVSTSSLDNTQDIK